MAAFVVNGTPVTVEKNQKLIRYLRDELHLTSVKDGCSEGACGTCHVLIDGKPTKACIPQTDKLEGKHIVTVEGLSAFEKEAFTYAFGEAGAVQCGFCIPGMVISAKGLIDQNPDPTREEAAFAIRNNICRCTGYVKIIDGILLAAKILREGKIPEKKEDFQVGSRVHRIDVAEKVQGYGKYPDDIYVDGMCYGGAGRSQDAPAPGAPASRTKMAVWSADENVDPIGACVGPKGQRVAAIVDELRGEKIDIIKWSEDPAQFIAAALAPSDVVDVMMAEEGKACRVIVPDDQLSLAIGKEGQNARLAARLVGYKIDIKPESYREEE